VALSGKVEFNSTASISYSSANESFTDIWDMGTEGIVASDLVSLGDSLRANLTFGLADQVDWVIAYLPIDGIFGIETDQPNDLSGNQLPPVLKQLAASGRLEQPIMTRQVNRSIDTWDGQGTIVLGSQDPDNCNQNYVYPTNTSYFGYPYFNITSVGAVAGGAAVAVNYSVIILDDFWPLYINNASVQVFVEASNASATEYTVYNYCSGDEYPIFNVSCDLLSANASGGSVVLGAENGAGVALSPADYILPYDGDCYLWVFDEAVLDYSDCYDYTSSETEEDSDEDESEGKWLVLGQLYGNNHCISTNLESAQVGLASVIGADAVNTADVVP